MASSSRLRWTVPSGEDMGEHAKGRQKREVQVGDGLGYPAYVPGHGVVASYLIRLGNVEIHSLWIVSAIGWRIFHTLVQADKKIRLYDLFKYENLTIAKVEDIIGSNRDTFDLVLRSQNTFELLILSHV